MPVQQCQPIQGGYSGGVPPLPIPNREVKPACADGTAQQCGRAGSRPFYTRSRRVEQHRPAAPFFMPSSRCPAMSRPSHGKPWVINIHSRDIYCDRLSASSSRAFRIPIARYGYKYPFTGYLLWQPFGQPVAACCQSETICLHIRNHMFAHRKPYVYDP